MDMAPILTVFFCILVAFSSGFVAYRFAIREVKKEIVEAFQGHIATMHAGHERFVETVKSVAPTGEK